MSKNCFQCGKSLSFRDSFIWNRQPVCRGCLKQLEMEQKGVNMQEMILPSHSPEAISLSYNSSIVVRRWAATALDMILFFGVILLLLGPVDIENINIFLIIIIPFIIVYYIVLEGVYGWTIGKLVLCIRVVDKDGNMPGITKASLRTLLRGVEVNPLLLGGVPAGIIVLLSKKRQRLGDLLAETYVIRKTDLTHSREQKL